MKRLLIILAAIFSFAGIQAQTYLNDGDYVTISFIANNFLEPHHCYNTSWSRRSLVPFIWRRC